MTPLEYSRQLSGWSTALIEANHDPTGGRWPRACAMLARRSIEEAIAAVWSRRALDMSQVPWRAQLLALPRYVEPTVARRINYTYGALSRACHHQAYDLPPTAAELTRWLTNVKDLQDALDVD